MLCKCMYVQEFNGNHIDVKCNIFFALFSVNKIENAITLFRLKMKKRGNSFVCAKMMLKSCGVKLFSCCWLPFFFCLFAVFHSVPFIIQYLLGVRLYFICNQQIMTFSVTRNIHSAHAFNFVTLLVVAIIFGPIE